MIASTTTHTPTPDSTVGRFVPNRRADDRPLLPIAPQNHDGAQPKAPEMALNSVVQAADAAKARLGGASNAATPTASPSSPSQWRQALSTAALGVAGVSGAVGLGGLAFYAFHRMGVDPSILVDPSAIQGIGEMGLNQVESAVRGLGQVHGFIDAVVQRHGQGASMGHLFEQLLDRGSDPEVFKQAVVNQAALIGGGNADQWASKMLDPATTLSPLAQLKVAEVVWYHDKQVALSEANSQGAMAFAQAGLSASLAALSVFAATNVETVKGVFKHMKDAARRASIEHGLIGDQTDRHVRRAVKASTFDVVEARARLAGEYAERQSPMHRLYTLHWLEAERAQDRLAMLQIFGMEPHSLGKHSAVGQAVMIDHFCATEMHALAQAEPEYAAALMDMAQRRDKLERNGLRPPNPLDRSGKPVDTIQDPCIGSMAAEHLNARKRSFMTKQTIGA